jgi:hypothetical protein
MFDYSLCVHVMKIKIIQKKLKLGRSDEAGFNERNQNDI